MPKRFFLRGLVKQLVLMLTLTHVLRVRGPSICAAVSNNNLYCVSRCHLHCGHYESHQQRLPGCGDAVIPASTARYLSCNVDQTPAVEYDTAPPSFLCLHRGNIARLRAA